MKHAFRHRSVNHHQFVKFLVSREKLLGVDEAISSNFSVDYDTVIKKTASMPGILPNPRSYQFTISWKTLLWYSLVLLEKCSQQWNQVNDTVWQEYISNTSPFSEKSVK